MKVDTWPPGGLRRPTSSRVPRSIALTAAIVLLVVYSFCRNTAWVTVAPQAFDLRKTLLSVPDPELARKWSAYYTSETHLAGQGLKQARWTRELWKSFGITNTTISSHNAQLPITTNQQRLAVLQGDRVLYEAPLVDNISDDFVPAYLGFSANGNVSGSFVFCNFGSQEDFDVLAKRNVSLAGNIAIMKLGNASPLLREKNLSIFRSVSVANAEKAGMIGAALFTDPGNDGPMREGNGYKPFPNGPARPLEAIERGGFGNMEDLKSGRIPTIPTLPMAPADAIRILSMLNGHGPSAKDLGHRWQGGGLDYYGVDYNVGPSPPGISIRLTNDAKIADTQVHNVIGTIPGRIQDELVIVGNHRDAWGPGAGDPGSGSVALNEVIRSFGDALKLGWRPERTIVFGSFEGEEFAQIGSLLWVTKHVDWLRQTAVAYLNVVVAASGSYFHAKASPLLYSALLSATGGVLSPNQTVPGQSVKDVWDGVITAAGSGDANRFMSIPCVSSVDFGFSPALGEPAFPYHTGLDSFEWMDKVGDPGWKYHIASARLWSLMTAHLLEPGVLKMSVVDYASAFYRWIDELGDPKSWSAEVDLTSLTEAVDALAMAAHQFDGVTRSLSLHQPAACNFWSSKKHDLAVRRANKVIIAFERQFYYEQGLDAHNDHHHVIFTPSAWHNSPPAMPGLNKALTNGDWENAKRWRDILSDKIKDATRLIETYLHETQLAHAPFPSIKKGGSL